MEDEAHEEVAVVKCRVDGVWGCGTARLDFHDAGIYADPPLDEYGEPEGEPPIFAEDYTSLTVFPETENIYAITENDLISFLARVLADDNLRSQLLQNDPDALSSENLLPRVQAALAELNQHPL